MTKNCCKCKEEKQLEAFSKNQLRCKACAKAQYDANQEKYKEYFIKNREKRSAVKKLWQEANKEKVQAKKKAWYEATKEARREETLARVKAYKKENPDKVNNANAKRRAQKLQATPKWMTKADLAAIEEWYKLAKDLQWLSEEKLHVDHIIPLKGKDVSGLHIAANLQILPASENVSKGNRIADHMVKYNETDFIGEVTEGVS